MYFDLSDYQFPFFSLISASISKQITRNHFGLNFEADSDRTVFRVLPKNQIVDDDDPLWVLVVSAAYY